ncbi:MAG TPA: OmpH family outer membrane protein [Allosphingosinicella sp.]
MKTKLIMGAAIAAAAAAAIPAIATAQPRAPAASILVVDTQRVLRECTACVAARSALQAQEASANQRAIALGVVSGTQGQPGALDREAQELQTAINALPQGRQPDAALQGRITAFQQRQQSAIQEIRSLQQNLQSTQAHVQVQLGQRLNPIFTQIMTSRGANLILPAEARLAHAPAIEVTNEVLAALNQQLPAVSVTPLPQQQQPAAQQPQQPRPGGR